MKTQLFKLVAVGIILMTAVVACKKDPKEGGGGTFVINATNVIEVDANDDIDSVKAIVYIGDYQVGAAKFQNNGFIINLCATVPDEYLRTMDPDIFDLMSDKNAKISFLIGIMAYNSAGIEIGEFLLRDRSDNRYCEAGYIYADRNFTIKYTNTYLGHTYTFDCNFKRGWNIIYEYDSDNEEGTATQKPSGVNLEWYYRSYGCHEKYAPLGVSFGRKREYHNALTCR
jgi:hypothetical protein